MRKTYSRRSLFRLSGCAFAAATGAAIAPSALAGGPSSRMTFRFSEYLIGWVSQDGSRFIPYQWFMTLNEEMQRSFLAAPLFDTENGMGQPIQLRAERASSSPPNKSPTD